MNLKKFISGVSALAVAASAFAGLAVTASADGIVETDFIGSSEAAETFDSYTAANGTWTNYKTLDAGETVKFVSGTAVYSRARGNTNTDEASYTLNSAVSTGKVTFDADIDTWSEKSTYDGSKVKFLDADGNAALEVSIPGSSGYIKPGDKSAKYSINPRGTNPNGFHIKAVFDLDTNKAAVTLTYDPANGSARYTETVEPTVDLSTIGGFSIWVPAYRNSTNQDIRLDNVKFYHEKLPTAAGALTVNYVANGAIIKTDAPSVEGKYVDDAFTYSFPAYVEADGKFYKTTETGFSKTVTLTEAALTDTVNYEAADKVVAFAEVDVANYAGHNPYAAAAANLNASDGKDGGTVYASGNCYQTFNVPVNGNYDITVNAVGTASKNRSVYLNVDGTDEATRIGTLSCNNGSTAVQTVNVDLTAGEHTFYFVGNGGISPILDYMVVELVKEIVPAADLKATVGDVETVSGTGSYAAEQATLFTVTVKNEGDADGSYNRVSVTDGNAKFTAEVPQITLAASETASVIYGGVVEGAYTFNAASVSYVE